MVVLGGGAGSYERGTLVRDVSSDSEHLSVTLSVAPLCPYSSAYRRGCGVSTSAGYSRNPFVVRSTQRTTAYTFGVSTLSNLADTLPGGAAGGEVFTDYSQVDMLVHYFGWSGKETGSQFRWGLVQTRQFLE